MERLELLSHGIAGQCEKRAYKKVSIEVNEATACGVIYMNSPKDLNALDTDLKDDLVAALSELNCRDSVKVIVLLSKVAKAFCAGVNIKEFKIGSYGYEEYLKNDVFKGICNAFSNIVKPIVCGVNGVAFGGGLELAMLCDVLTFREDAKIGLPELNLGLMPGMGGTQRLPLIVGKYNAMRAILTGQPIQAAHLKQLGYDVFPVDKFEESVLKLAQTIASRSASSLIVAKQSVNASASLGLNEGMNFERSIFYPLMNTKGASEGVTAFIEKRKPNFKGM